MPSILKKEASKGVPPPPPPPGLPSIEDCISQMKFAARLQTSHELRGGHGIPVLPPRSMDHDDSVGGDGSIKAKKSKNKSSFKPRFLSKSS
ncbi:unnamed protein product [Cylindrotheca closterium]|uniref:Uncharacterized protein n=1 Tax=Cylindrotheca closterium TaxID=2856 RepID=A0AAD2JLX5_9STRA|nr:unnamed protein product [Cylindrotheca closterium]